MKYNRLILFLLLIGIVIFSLLAIMNTLWYPFFWKNEALHATAVTLGSLSAIFMALLLLHRQPQKSEGRIFWMALGLLSMGSLDFFHAFTQPGYGFVLLHSMSIFLGGFFFALVWLPATGKSTLYHKHLPWFVCVCAGLFGIYTVLFRDTLPVMAHSGDFTTFAVTVNLFGGVFFLIAAGRFLLDFNRSGKIEYYMFSCMSLLFGLSGLLFRYSAIWYDGWWFWHLLNMTAFLLVLGFVVHQYLNMVSDLRVILIKFEKLEDTLRRSEKKFRILVEQASDGIFVADQKGYYVDVNTSGCKMLGYTKEEILKLQMKNLIPDKDLAREPIRMDKLLSGETVINERLLKHKNGQLIPVEISAKMLPDGRLQGIVRDITERKHTEEKIKQSLREKEILLKEIHHRVKNNLQLISSMLNLQFGGIKEPELINLFKDSQYRIRSMALIHERLYHSSDLAEINMQGYIELLSDYLYRMYKVDSQAVELRVEVNNVYLDINHAIPCGLIINELISNSLKYAFPDNGQGEIFVELGLAGGNYSLQVGDTGMGFPRELDYKNTKTLGMQLIIMLVEQLEGNIHLIDRDGTLFKIIFPQK